MKKDTLYVRAAKGQQLTTVFGSYHLSTSNLETDLVNHLVKLEEEENQEDDAVTIFSFLKNNEIRTVDDFKEARERQRNMSKRQFKTPAVKLRNRATQEDPKQESAEVLGALALLMKELVDELVAETQMESEIDTTLGGGTLVERSVAMAEVVNWKPNDEGAIGPLLDIASRVDKLTTSHFAMGETVDHLVSFVKLDIIDDEQDAVQVAHLNRISALEVGIGLPDRSQECSDTLWNGVMETLRGLELAATRVV